MMTGCQQRVSHARWEKAGVARTDLLVAVVAFLLFIILPPTVFNVQFQRPDNTADIENAKVVAGQVRTYYQNNPDRIEGLQAACASSPWALEVIVSPEGTHFYASGEDSDAHDAVMDDMEAVFGACSHQDDRGALYCDAYRCSSSIPWSQYCVGITTKHVPGDEGCDPVHVIYTAWPTVDRETYNWVHLTADRTGFSNQVEHSS